ncbi:MAG TPA: transposase [Phycisphaerae bacterium]|nr:transposase [Phycisphaerae bacterium]
MPNHVHALLTPSVGYALSEILHSWKSFTAKKVNRLLGRTGEFWMPEYYDHLIRDEQDLAHHRDYILGNPEKANLGGWSYVGAL